MFQRNLHLQKLFLSLFLLAVIIPDLGLLAVIVPAQCVFAVVVLEQFELAVTIPDLFVLAVSAPAQCVFAVVVLELIHVQSLFQTRFQIFETIYPGKWLAETVRAPLSQAIFLCRREQTCCKKSQWNM